MHLILASGSPRRKELIREITADFSVEPSFFEETGEGLSARDTVLAFARGKAEEVAGRFPGALVVGADTVVCLDGEILGKPKNADGAKKMLRRLSGRTHTVFTGVCVVYGGKTRTRAVASDVTFHRLSEALIERYVASGHPLDKAGAYGIQDGFPIVERYEGSFTNIVGLPVEETRELIEQAIVDAQ